MFTKKAGIILGFLYWHNDSRSKGWTKDCPGGRRGDVTNEAAVLRSDVILKCLLAVNKAMKSHTATFQR